MNENPKNDGPHLIIGLLNLVALLIPPFSMIWFTASISNIEGGTRWWHVSILATLLGTAFSFWICATVIQLLKDIRDEMRGTHPGAPIEKKLEAAAVTAEESNKTEMINDVELDELAKQADAAIKALSKQEAIARAVKQAESVDTGYKGQW